MTRLLTPRGYLALTLLALALLAVAAGVME